MELTTRINFLEHIELLKDEHHANSGFNAIADFILTNQDNEELWNRKMNIYTFASLTNSSSSSVTRFAQKLGLDGFKELLLILRSRDATLTNYLKTPVDDNEVILAVSTLSLNEIDESIKMLKKINDCLKLKKRIFFFGVNDNFILVNLVIPILEDNGIKVYFNNELDQQEFYFSKLSHDDIAVLMMMDFQDVFFKTLNEKIQKYHLISIIVTRDWKNKMLNFFDRKYLLKLTTPKNGYLVKDSYSIGIVYYLGVLFKSTLDSKS